MQRVHMEIGLNFVYYPRKMRIHRLIEPRQNKLIKNHGVSLD